jgi:hypothetical protein
VLVLAVGLAVRVGIAAPRATAAELRAIACCARHCPDAPRVPMRPQRCCFVDSGATDPASTTDVRPLERPATTATVALPASASPVFVACPIARTVAGRIGPPSLLDTLRLRC